MNCLLQPLALLTSTTSCGKKAKKSQISSSHASIRRQLVKLQEIVNNFSIFAFFCPLHSFIEFYHLPFIHSFSKLQHGNPIYPPTKLGTFTRRVCWSYMIFAILLFAYRILGKTGAPTFLIFALWLTSHWYSLHISVSSFFFAEKKGKVKEWFVIPDLCSCLPCLQVPVLQQGPCWCCSKT